MFVFILVQVAASSAAFLLEKSPLMDAHLFAGEKKERREGSREKIAASGFSASQASVHY